MVFDLPPSKRQKRFHKPVEEDKCSVFQLPAKQQEPESALLMVPEEMFNTILTFLQPSDIGQLSLTSHLVRRKVSRWFSTRGGIKHVVKRAFNLIDTEPQFKLWISTARTFGTLAKRLTMLFGTNKRVEFLVFWYKKFRNFCLGEPVITDEWNTLLHVVGLSTALAQFSSGWDDSEFGAVIAVLDNRFGFREKLKMFLKSKHRCPDVESDLKIILRSFYWDQGVMIGSFLAHLFKSTVKMNDKNIGDLIYLMVGPSSISHQLQGADYQNLTKFQRRLIFSRVYHPQWDALEDEVLTSYGEAKDMLEDMGQLFSTMYFSDRIPTYRVHSILDHIIGTVGNKDPTWLVDNVATMLLFSSSAFIKSYIQHCINTDSKINMISMVTAMIIVCDRMDNDLVPPTKAGVDSILEWVLSEPTTKAKKMSLFKEFWEEMKRRCENDDISGGMLVQLGRYLCHEAFHQATSKKPQLDLEEEMTEE